MSSTSRHVVKKPLASSLRKHHDGRDKLLKPKHTLVDATAGAALGAPVDPFALLYDNEVNYAAQFATGYLQRLSARINNAHGDRAHV